MTIDDGNGSNIRVICKLPQHPPLSADEVEFLSRMFPSGNMQWSEHLEDFQRKRIVRRKSWAIYRCSTRDLSAWHERGLEGQLCRIDCFISDQSRTVAAVRVFPCQLTDQSLLPDNRFPVVTYSEDDHIIVNFENIVQSASCFHFCDGCGCREEDGMMEHTEENKWVYNETYFGSQNVTKMSDKKLRQTRDVI